MAGDDLRPLQPSDVALAEFDPWAESIGCCALDDGHDGACAWKCSTCGGTGECPECGGVMEDDLDWCDYCQKAGCPGGCYEGWVGDD